MVQALLPLKDLVAAKTRLAGLLRPTERRALAQAMVEDVLTVLQQHPAISRITIVSDDPGAAMLAQRYGAQCWSEDSLGCSGLNPLMQCASERLLQDLDEPLIVLHGDLPLLCVDDIDAVIQTQLERQGLVIGCDRLGIGTNLLAFDAAAIPVFAFGQNSCAAHLEWAAGASISGSLVKRSGIGVDVDEPHDLQVVLSALQDFDSGKTRDLLYASELGSRVKLALETLTVGDAARGDQLKKETRVANEVLAPAQPEDGQVKTAFPSLLDESILEELTNGATLLDEQALALSEVEDTAALMRSARQLRDLGHGNIVTYSRKVFIPLTQLCRDVCHYCTFAQTPKKIAQAFMPVEEVVELCRQGALMGAQEALFTLGEKPELRYNAARTALAEMGYDSTLSYLRDVASRVLAETGLLPHINAGCMDAQEIAELRQVSASMGIMLESASERLCQKGMPHYGSPDKEPQRRLETLELAGQANVPFTSGILIGIGETRRERIESLLALRAVHQRHGHLQEVIVQNFRAKPNTLMSQAPEPDLDELLWTIAVARLIFGAQMSIQAPPNLSPGVLPQLVDAGINDWGGVSPLTPDHVNPEAPWPHLDKLAAETAVAGKFLDQRLTIYPDYVIDADRWLDAAVTTAVLNQSDAAGFARRDTWVPGAEQSVPETESRLLKASTSEQDISPDIKAIVARCWETSELSNENVTRLFNARGPDFSYVVAQADQMRQQVNGDTVSYVVNRNINYTNVCYFKCQFCAFSKGKQSENLRGKPYDISGEEIASRCVEAWDRGATEVCMQGGIHPDYTGQTYLDILRTVRTATPDMHIHAFSPLEVRQGAATLGVDLQTFIRQLKEAGLNTLPGTAAEVLHDDVRAVLCPDKLNTQEWLEVMATAHAEGMRTTATIMYGHIDRPKHWASHLLHIRALQERTGGFTEFVPLPFVHMEAPLYLKGRARPGPSFREAILMHSVARLVFHGLIHNIQGSWVKMGREGVNACLNAGVNDLGGSLMNESITRAAGSEHGQEWSPPHMEAMLRAANRKPRMRNTLYGDAPTQQRAAAFEAQPLTEVHNAGAGKQQTSKLLEQPLRFARSAQALDHTLYEQVVLMAACN